MCKYFMYLYSFLENVYENTIGLYILYYIHLKVLRDIDFIQEVSEAENT